MFRACGDSVIDRPVLTSVLHGMFEWHGMLRFAGSDGLSGSVDLEDRSRGEERLDFMKFFESRRVMKSKGMVETSDKGSDLSGER